MKSKKSKISESNNEVVDEKVSKKREKARLERLNEIEINNVLEEIGEILSPCIKCGMCKSICPVFAVLREEKTSPRGHSIMLQEKIVNELVMKCTLCKACEKRCPLNLKICDAMKKAREVLILGEDELKSNKEMVKNIREKGTPFSDSGEKNPDKLYCC